MTNLTAKLDRTATSLTNHVARGNTLNGMRSQQLVDRFEELKAAAIEAGIWTDWTVSKGYAESVNAYDFFA